MDERCDHDNPMSLVTAADGCSLECPICHEIVVEVELVCIPVTVSEVQK